MHILSICSGIGGLERGISIATGGNTRTVCHVEGEIFCASVLAARGKDDGSAAPIWSDVKTFDARPWRGKVDCITAGFPCQPWSLAGQRKGTEDPRHLWPYIAQHIRTINPAFVFCENVPGHLSLGFQEVCEELCEMGYSVEAGIFSASECGAPHLRKRLFFLAYAPGDRWPACVGNCLRVKQGARDGLAACACGSTGNMAHADGSRCDVGQRSESGSLWNQTWRAQPQRRGRNVANPNSEGEPQQDGPDGNGSCVHRDDGRSIARLGRVASGLPPELDLPGWPADWEDGVPRVATGIAHRTDRLRALGNAVVPQTAALAWTTLFQQALDKQKVSL